VLAAEHLTDLNVADAAGLKSFDLNRNPLTGSSKTVRIAANWNSSREWFCPKPIMQAFVTESPLRRVVTPSRSPDPTALFRCTKWFYERLSGGNHSFLSQQLNN
jgi:hypothetical protein